MKVTLFPYESRTLKAAENTFSLSRRLTGRFALSLKQLRDTFDRVSRLENGTAFHQGRVAVMGLVNHTQHLLIGGLMSLNEGNSHVWSACVRGLLEAFGACVLIEEHPASAPNYLGDRIKAGKLRAAAERAQPGTGADIDRLNSIVHPASGAIHAGFRVLDRENRTARFQYGLLQPSKKDGEEAVTVLANLAELLGEKLLTLSQAPAVLESGKVIMERMSELDGAG